MGAWRIWTPPPCIAKVSVDQMCEVKHVFPQTQHLFVCPALMTGVWSRKQLMKVADARITMLAGNDTWIEEMFEPLTIAFVAPPLSTSPWKAGRTTRVEKWQKQVQALSSHDSEAFRNCMREFWLSDKRESASVPRSVARWMLHPIRA